MPTTYKVLGQTTTTAASSQTVLNLVKDPDIEGFTGADVSVVSGSTSIGATGTLWQLFVAASTQASFSNALNNSISAPFNSRAAGLWMRGSVSGSQGCHLAYGYTAGNTDLNGETAGFFSSAAAIPVSASTTYYAGGTCKAYNSGYFSSGNGFWPTMYIKWWTSSGTYISSTTVANNGGTTNGSTVLKNTFSSPSTAAYATILFRWYYNGWNGSEYVFFDGIYFGTDTTYYNAAFSSPAAANNSLLTAPFNKRTDGGYTGTANSSTTGTTFAGALTDLYTVPSATSTVASTLTLANLSSSATTYRVLVLKSGETAAKKNFIAFDAPIGANSTDTYTLGMTLATGDKVQVASDVADVSATLFGSEIS